MLTAIWAWIASSASVATLIGCGALAVAILLPKQLDFITDLRKWAIVVAACAFGYTATFTRGMSHGLAVKQAEWDAALVRETGNGEAARDDAERSVGPMPTDRRLLRSDPFNRNSGDKPLCQ